MTYFFQQVVDGVTTGSIYALLALAIVITHRATGVANFGQGEMAMFATYFSWQLTVCGVPLIVAILLAVAASILAGMLVERVLVRPVEGKNPLTIVVLTLGIFLVLNQVAGLIWTFRVREVASVFSGQVLDMGGVRLAMDSLGIVLVLLVAAGLLYLLLQHTKLGLVMRAAAMNKDSSELVGIDVSRMLMLGWGLAAGIGCIAGAMIAPRLFLEPNMMLGPLLFAFAAATLGGIDSLLGAVVGGVIVGVSENLAGAYVDFVGSELKVLVPLVIILAVLVVRPNGLFGQREVVRV